MAVRIIRIDDLDGSDPAEETPFEIDGRSYSIDLGPRNRARFFRAIRPFIERSRLIRGEESISIREVVEEDRESDRCTVLVGEAAISEDPGAA